MKTSNMTPKTREICPTTLKAGDQFMPLFNDNVYTVKNDFDPNTEGVFLDGPDYCGHCTFFDCPTVRLIEATPGMTAQQYATSCNGLTYARNLRREKIEQLQAFIDAGEGERCAAADLRAEIERLGREIFAAAEKVKAYEVAQITDLAADQDRAQVCANVVNYIHTTATAALEPYLVPMGTRVEMEWTLEQLGKLHDFQAGCFPAEACTDGHAANVLLTVLGSFRRWIWTQEEIKGDHRDAVLQITGAAGIFAEDVFYGRACA